MEKIGRPAFCVNRCMEKIGRPAICVNRYMDMEWRTDIWRSGTERLMVMIIDHAQEFPPFLE
jgi:hypothetical protein